MRLASPRDFPGASADIHRECCIAAQAGLKPFVIDQIDRLWIQAVKLIRAKAAAILELVVAKPRHSPVIGAAGVWRQTREGAVCAIDAEQPVQRGEVRGQGAGLFAKAPVVQGLAEFSGALHGDTEVGAQRGGW